jgi:hypothetical protein
LDRKQVEKAVHGKITNFSDEGPTEGRAHLRNQEIRDRIRQDKFVPNVPLHKMDEKTRRITEHLVEESHF